MQARNTIEPLRPEAFLPAVIHCKMEGWRLVQLCATRLPEGYELSYSFAKELDLRTLRLVVKEEDGVLHLTEDGEELARAVYEKHVFFQRMFMQLGVDESVAGRDACLVEHAVSDEVFEKLKERYDHVLAEGGQ